MPINWLDGAVVGVYCLGLAAIVRGVRPVGPQTVDDYLVAGRSFKALPIAVSLLVTQFTAIGFVGLPGWVFANDLRMLLPTLLTPLVMVGAAYLVLPRLFELGAHTSFELLRDRVGPALEKLGGALYVVVTVGWLSTMLYATAVLSEAITHVPFRYALPFFALVSLIYTYYGGLKAIVWTDVFQLVVIMIGLVAIGFHLGSALDWNPSAAWRLAGSRGTTRLLDLTVDPTVEISALFLLASNVIGALNSYGTDQTVLQRCLAGDSWRVGLKAVALAGVSTVPVFAALSLVGVALSALTAADAVPALSDAGPDQVMVLFLRDLPNGLRALMVVAVVSATMSSVDSGLHAVATCLRTNVLPRRDALESAAEIRVLRRLVILTCLLSTGLASVVGRVGEILIISGVISSYCIGPMAAILLSVSNRRPPGSIAAVLAVGLGFLATAAFAYWTGFTFLLNSVVGFSVTLIASRFS